VSGEKSGPGGHRQKDEWPALIASENGPQEHSMPSVHHPTTSPIQFPLIFSEEDAESRFRFAADRLFGVIEKERATYRKIARFHREKTWARSAMRKCVERAFAAVVELGR
jgi:hypothetical protein